MDKLPKWQANYTALTPLTFLSRASACYANRASVIHEGTRFTWAQTYERCRRLASSLRALNIATSDVVSLPTFFLLLPASLSSTSKILNPSSVYNMLQIVQTLPFHLYLTLPFSSLHNVFPGSNQTILVVFFLL